RTEDIPALAARFLSEAGSDGGRSLRGIASDALRMLERYAWPGNVRELRNVIERAGGIADGDVLTVADLPERIRSPSEILVGRTMSSGAASDASALSTSQARSAAGASTDMKSQLLQFEAEVILSALKRSNWNQSEAARELKIPLRTLVHKIKVYGIKK